MPELPEVETVCKGIAKHALKTTIEDIVIRQDSLRWKIQPDLALILKKQKFINISRRGKYLLFKLSSGTVISHLGMSGSWYISNKNEAIAKHDHVILHIDNNKQLRYNDPRRFGFILWCTHPPEEHHLLKKLGPEPLSNNFSGDTIFQRCKKSLRPIKTTIMDPSCVVGVGNIYANEVLFKAYIHPKTPSKNLSKSQCNLLAQLIKEILQESILKGGTTLKDFVNIDKKPGYFKQSLLVYARKNMPCKNCTSNIESIVIGQRSSFFCPKCQKIL